MRWDECAGGWCGDWDSWVGGLGGDRIDKGEKVEDIKRVGQVGEVEYRKGSGIKWSGGK